MTANRHIQSFAWKLGASLCAFAALNVLVYFNSDYFARAREYHAVLEAALQPQSRLLVLGDSHAARLRAPILPESASNAAMGGDGPRESYAKLRYALDRHEPIDTVLLSADAHMFGQVRQQSSNRAFVDRYLIVTHSPYGLERGRLFALMNTVPLFHDEYVQYLQVAVPARFGKKTSGSRVPSTPWVEIPAAEQAELARRIGAEDHKGVGDYDESLEWYARTLALARSHDVRVLLVRYPGHPEYVRTIPAAKLRQIDSRLTAIGFEPVLDFSTAFSDPTYFTDPDHMSPRGAAALLQLLDARFKSLGISSPLAGYPAGRATHASTWVPASARR